MCARCTGVIPPTYNEGQDDDRYKKHQVQDARDSPLLVEHLSALSTGTNQKPEVVVVVVVV